MKPDAIERDSASACPRAFCRAFALVLSLGCVRELHTVIRFVFQLAKTAPTAVQPEAMA